MTSFEQRITTEFKGLGLPPIPFAIRSLIISQEPASAPGLVQSREIEKQGSDALRTQVTQDLRKQGIQAEKVRTSTTHTHTHTHTASTKLIAVVGSIIPIGIDIESLHRSVHPSLRKKIVKSNEADRPELHTLEYWAIKEACFKANPLNEGTVISRYQIQDWSAQTRRGIVHLSSGFQASFVVFRMEDWVISLAIEKQI